jgi:uncharacterized protein (DUF58 family)
MEEGVAWMSPTRKTMVPVNPNPARTSRRRFRLRIPGNEGIRDFIGALLLLFFAFGLALLGAAGRQYGSFGFSIVLSALALLIVVLVVLFFVPRFIRRARSARWGGGLRFLRVTRRGLLFLLLVLLIAGSTFNTGNNLLVLVLSFLLAALLVSGMASNAVLQGLRVTLSLPEAIHAGQTAVALVTLHNEKRLLPSFALNLRTSAADTSSEESTDFFQRERLFAYLPPRTSQTDKLECRFLRRGVYPLRGFEVHTKFPFGFVSRGREVPAEGRITVYPALMDLKNQFWMHPFLLGAEHHGRRGLGTGLYNIRDYQRGDSARHVHWKATAKLSTLMVKEFLEEADPSLQLVFSTYLPRRDNWALEQFEKGLSCVTTLACRFQAEARPFRFYSGEYEAVVGRDRFGFENLLEYLAWVNPSDRMLIDRQKIGTRALVLVAGDSLDCAGNDSVDYLTL